MSTDNLFADLIPANSGAADDSAPGGMFDDLIPSGQGASDSPSYVDQQDAVENGMGVRVRDDGIKVGGMRAYEPSFLDRRVINPLRSGYYRGKQGVSLLLNDLGITKPDPIDLAQNNRLSERYAPSLADQEAMQRVSNADSIGGVFSELWDNPHLITDVTMESLGVMAPGLAVTAGASVAGGPLAAAMAAGSSSGSIEYSQTISSVLQENGVDPSDPMSWAMALSDPDLMSKARESGIKRGVPVAVFDALTAGLAGKIMIGAKGGLVSPTVRAGGELGLQAGGGMAGEAGAQVADKGEITSIGDVALEGIAEVPTAIVEAPGNIAHARAKARQSADPAGSTGDNIPDAISAEGVIGAPEPAQTEPTELEQAAALYDQVSGQQKAGTGVAFDPNQRPVVPGVMPDQAFPVPNPAEKNVAIAVDDSAIAVPVAGVTTPKPTRAQTAKAKYEEARKVNTKTDKLSTIIAKLGGLSKAEAEANGIDAADMPGHGWRIIKTFSNGKNVDTLDGMREKLNGYGFNFETVNDLLDALREDISSVGADVYSPEGLDAQMEAKAAAYQDAQEQQAELDKPPVDEFTGDMYLAPAEAEASGELPVYDPNWDDDAKTLAELYYAAKKLDPVAADTIYESGDSDSGVALRLYDLIRENDNGRSEEAAAQPVAPADQGASGSHIEIGQGADPQATAAEEANQQPAKGVTRPNEPAPVLELSSPTENGLKAQAAKIEANKPMPDEQPALVQSGDELFANNGKLEADLFADLVPKNDAKPEPAKSPVKQAFKPTHELSDGTQVQATDEPNIWLDKDGNEIEDSYGATPIDSTLDAKAHEAATSPKNDKPEPTEAQKSAGNYAKGKVRLHGMDISIENPKGSTRSGTSATGKSWSNKMAHHYGYVKSSTGKDGDQVDVFLSDDAENPNHPVFVIDQVKDNGRFDEHKVMIGFPDEAAAVAAYQANYEKGWRGIGGIQKMSLEKFRDWVKDPVKTKRRASVKKYRYPDQGEKAASGKAVENETKANPKAPVRGTVGGKLGAGEVVLTATGRETSPFPRIDTITERRAQNTLKRVDEWLIQNAIQEAEARGDDFNLTQFRAVDRRNPSQADKDSAEEYLFGDHIPTVLKSSLKPLTAKSDKGSASDTGSKAAADAKALLAEQRASDPLNKTSQANLKRKLRRLAKKTPADDQQATLALDMVATRLGVDDLEFADPEGKPDADSAETKSDKSEVADSLKQELQQKQQRYKDLSEKFGENDSAVIQLADQISGLKERIKQADGAVVDASEYHTKEADRAYSHSSHNPSAAAKIHERDFIESVQSLHDDLMGLAETDAQKAVVAQQVEQYKAAYLKREKSLLGARAATVSGHVAGRSKFNAKQAARRGNALDRATDDFFKWIKESRSEARKAVLDARTPEQKDRDRREAKEASERTEAANRAVEEKRAEEKKKATAQKRALQIINDPDSADIHMTMDEWKREPSDYKSVMMGNGFRYRSVLRTGGLKTVFISDRKVVKADTPNQKESNENEQPKVAAAPARSEDGGTGGRQDDTGNRKPAPVNKDEVTADTAPEPASEREPVSAEAEGIKNNPDPDAKDLKGGPYTLQYHNDLIEAANNGDLSLSDFHSALDAFVANQDEIKARLNQYTKPVLKNIAGGWLRGDEKKADLVDKAFERIRNFFTLDKETPVFSYIFGQDLAKAERQYHQKIIDVAKSVTDEDLRQWAGNRAEAKAEREKSNAAQKKAIADPQTLDDFHTYIRAKKNDGMTYEEARMSLSPEQRAEYDRLTAEKSRSDRRYKRDEAKSEVSATGVTTGAEIIATKHTRDGYDLFVVQTKDRVEKDIYREWLATAKKLGGWYSRFRGRGAVPGFQFKDRESAEAFQAYITKGDTNAAQQKAQELRDAFTDDRSQTVVERLREMADRLEERGTDSLNKDRKVNTTRRAGMAARAEEQAQAEIAMAKTMRNIADRIESGEAQFLDRVRQKVQVEMLQTFARLAHDAMNRKKYPAYQDQEAHKHDRQTAESADYAEFPEYTVYRSDLATLGRQALEIDGMKKIGQQIMKVADDVTDAYIEFAKENLHKVSTFTDVNGGLAIFSNKTQAEAAIKRSGFKGRAIVLPIKRGENLIVLSPSEAQKRGLWDGDGDKRIALSPDFANDLIEKARHTKGIEVPWQLLATHEKRKRLSAMGIETPAEFRAALREFIETKIDAKRPDKVKEMERAMVGRSKDGLDFFPTPTDVADKMVSVADIQDGMSVLEPSAGMGHIAERIREAGAEPDVVELSGSRRELLKAKGFNVVGSDFLEVAGEYDRIIMNPPFSDRRDAEHVRHAYDLLKPGGRLVAITGEGVFFGKDKKASAFRDWLEEVGGSDEKLAEGTFQDPSLPVTTGVNARMIVIEKKDGKFSRDAPKHTTQRLPKDKVVSITSTIAKRWNNAPSIIVAESMNDPVIPEEVRHENERQLSQGASGDVEGFIHNGKVYLVADALTKPEQVVRVLMHESLGHAGLQGVFGKKMTDVLNQLIAVRPKEVRAKAEKYGLDMNSKTDRMIAAEEVLAELAETKPEIGIVRRAIAVIRAWLRRNVPGFMKMKVSDDEILQQYILPARRFIERGDSKSGDGLKSKGSFSRDDKEGRGFYDSSTQTPYKRKVLVAAKKSYDEQVQEAKNPPSWLDDALGGIISETDIPTFDEWLVGKGSFRRPDNLPDVPENTGRFFGPDQASTLMDILELYQLSPLWAEEQAFRLLPKQLREDIFANEGGASFRMKNFASELWNEALLKTHEPLEPHDAKKIADYYRKNPVEIQRLANDLYASIKSSHKAEERELADAFAEMKRMDWEASPDGRRAGFRVISGDKATGNPSDHKTRLSRGGQVQDPDEANDSFIEHLKKGQPLDRVFQLPFNLIGSIDSKGDWHPPENVSNFARKAAARLNAAAKSAGEKMPWAEHLFKEARAGLIDRYGLSDEYKERDAEREADERIIAMRGVEIIQDLEKRGVNAAEAKVLQAILNGEVIADDEWFEVSEPIRRAIDELGQEAVMLGLISNESYERNKASYLHRVYMKHEDQSTLGGWASKIIAKRRKKLIGNSMRGRGMDLKVTTQQVLKSVPDAWFGKKLKQGAADKQLKGHSFIVFDRMSHVGQGTKTAPGIEDGGRKSRILERHYWPADKPVPAKYGSWDNKGTWEVRSIQGDKVVLWRDFTKEERLSMGEILDARYTIAKTFQHMSHDLATGRFLKDIASNDAWTWIGEGEPENAVSAKEGGYLAYGNHEWVLVPNTSIPGTGGKKRWGALAGKYVRSEIWRDLNELDRMNVPGTWRKILTQWKLNKTARNPVVHMNNVMSNLLFMDMANVRMTDLAMAVKAMHENSQDYQDAMTYGAFGGSFVNQEIQKNILDPILDELRNQNLSDHGPLEARIGQLGKFLDTIWKYGKSADQWMIEKYQMEDEVFRMATYLRRRSLGESPEVAATTAREQFLNYDIRAPWVNALRNTVLPFISYTYRAVPVIAESMAKRPWKLAKYAAVAYAVNALGYAISGGDEDKERRSLRDQKQGNTWLPGVPRMIRMPWRDSNDNPVFLDIRRWIPAGDIFDTNQGQGTGIPAPLQMGGPLMLAGEFMLNKTAFTGKEIWNNKTDEGARKAAKVADWAWKSWMPSAPWVYNSWYWDKIVRSLDGSRDSLGRQYDPVYAVSSSFGIKLKQHDVNLGFAGKKYDIQAVERALKYELRILQRDRKRNKISADDYKQEVEAIREKMKRLRLKAKETFGHSK